mgnify:CR=1 FL=1
MVLVNGIDLNDGNMDMGKMKSVLDADVENIRNAKATVEKMIEEKMLGTEADGTIGVRLADGQINYHDKKGQEYIARNTALEFLKETEQVFLFFYCEDGKLKKAETDNGSSLTYCYNQRGQLEEVKDWLGTTKIAMDEAGRIASVTDPYGKTVGYEWGSMGERTAVLYPDGKKTVYEYNEAMQLTAMKIFSGEMREKTIRYSYDEAGRLIGKQLPGRNYTDYRYNAAGKLEEILHKGADKSAVAGNKCKRNERLCV